jgi:hypothetical protein
MMEKRREEEIIENCFGKYPISNVHILILYFLIFYVFNPYVKGIT